MTSRIDAAIHACKEELRRHYLGMSLPRRRDHVTSKLQGECNFYIRSTTRTSDDGSQYNYEALIRVRGDQAFATLGKNEYEYDQNHLSDLNKEVKWGFISDPFAFKNECSEIDNADENEQYFVSAYGLEIEEAGQTSFSFILIVNDIEYMQDRSGGYYRLSPKYITVTFNRK
jgi:hypothetical protein